MLYKTEGIIIRAIDYGEGNKIVTIFTESFGKVGVMARGAKKIKSRHSAVTQPFTQGVYTYYKGNANALATLNDGEIVQTYYHSDIEKMAYTAYVTEWVDRVWEEKEPSPYLYAQYKAALEAIKADKDGQIIAHVFELKMLQLVGYKPIFHHCTSCGSEDGLQHFNPSSGGMVCGKCVQTERQFTLPVNGKSLLLLRLLERMDLNRLGKVHVSAETKSQLKELFRSFIDEHLPLRWKSRPFLDQLEKFHQD